jgi:8-oxo-dGTP diphosphatase
MKKKCLPQVAVGAIIFKDERILLVKRAKPPAKGMWAIPGGKIISGESMKEALKREIKEETNLDINIGEVVYVFDVMEYDEDKQLSFHYVIIDFECTYKDGILKAGDDALDASWVAENELDGLNLNINTRDMLKQKFNFAYKKDHVYSAKK